MNVTAISPIARVAAPYAAHIARVDDTRPSWEAERLAQTVAAREAQRSAQAQAAWEAQRIARAREAARSTEAARASDSPASSQTIHTRADAAALAAADALPSLDVFRDQYADTRLRRALDAYTAQPDPVAQRAGNANDLGTIEGLMPLQAYRVAMANPQVQELQTAVAMKAASVAVPAVANIGATENATDNARYRPGFSAAMS
ncbi:hypothetical protein [Achromobacter spanius]|uniref:Uncharacterized protein n=1 Tax=Achromobacter spanius TaxID=217203 RepID=A0AA42IX28_9BURK|nr:hypothetical protein [Achromobacter spanius]MDH0736760.1 hypothetical protein [Achromobacter spanius]